jgi:hypothetical protein
MIPYNPNHDSLYMRFEQLNSLLEDLRKDIPSDVWWRVVDIKKLVNLIRGQLIK